MYFQLSHVNVLLALLGVGKPTHSRNWPLELRKEPTVHQPEADKSVFPVIGITRSKGEYRFHLASGDLNYQSIVLSANSIYTGCYGNISIYSIDTQVGEM